MSVKNKLFETKTRKDYSKQTSAALEDDGILKDLELSGPAVPHKLMAFPFPD